MASKDDIIAELRGIVAAQAKQIEDLKNRIADLELKLAKAQKNSSNSLKRDRWKTEGYSKAITG